jgi:hypothetical protein
MLTAFISNFAMTQNDNSVTAFDLKDFGVTAMFFCVRIAIESLILWLSALIFLDQDLQRIWKRGKIGRVLARRPMSTIAWTFGTVILFGSMIVVDMILGVISVGFVI